MAEQVSAGGVRHHRNLLWRSRAAWSSPTRGGWSNLSKGMGILGDPRISIVVPFRNSASYLEPCCAALRHAMAAHGAAELIMVDNGSTDGSRVIAATAADVLLTVDGGLVGAVRNAGAATARGDILVFVDSDCVVPPDHLLRIERAFSDGTTDVVGRPYVLPPDPHWLERTWVTLHDTAVRSPRYVPAGNLAIRAATFRSLGGFDETLAAGEDADLCKRLLAQGGRLKRDDDLRVIHLGNPKSVSAFLKQQIWHAQGKFSLAELPLVAALAHMAAVALAVVLLLKGVPWIALAPAALTAVPFTTVVYRMRSARSRVPLLPAMFLYNVYFVARIWGAALSLSALREGAANREPDAYRTVGVAAE